MKTLFKEIGLLLIGCLLFSLCVCVFLVPNKIGTGGLTGVSLGLNQLFNIPIGFTTLIMNIPLLFSVIIF